MDEWNTINSKAILNMQNEKYSMMDPLVSIPVITYNHLNFIHQTLNGILMQEVNFKYEIIIGDDFSTDGTKDIILKYAKKYPDAIKVITSEVNVGFLKNSIRLLKACNGKYFAFCEGDDYWTDNLKLQKQVDFLEKNKDYGMVHTDANHFYQKDKKFVKDYNKSNSIHFPSGSIFIELLKNYYLIKTATVMVRKELFLNAFNYKLFEDRKWLMTDFPIWLEIAANSKIKYFDEPTATYRLMEESASRTKDIKKMHEFHKSVFDIRFYYWEKYSKKNEIKEKLERDYHIMLLGDAYRMKDKQLAKKAYDYFKKDNFKLPFKHKAKYWAINNKIIRIFLDKMIKIKKYLTKYD